MNAGYVQTGGNTDVVTMLASGTFKWKRGVQYRSQPLPWLERLDWTIPAGLQFT